MTEEATIEVEEGSANVYADLGWPDAGRMLLKAQLASQVGEAIRRRKLTQAAAAEIIGLPQPKLSGLLRGQFRGVSEASLRRVRTRLASHERGWHPEGCNGLASFSLPSLGTNDLSLQTELASLGTKMTGSGDAHVRL